MEGHHESTINNDELQRIQLTKCREYDSLSLTRRLQFEAELTAKAKAKEEVFVCALQSHIQEMQENKEQLDKEILNLQAFKENLQRELSVEDLNSSHIEKQMKNTGKIVDMLKQTYEGLEKAYQAELEDTKRLEQEDQNWLQNYQGRKEELQTNIKTHDAEIQELKAVLEKENEEYNTELGTKKDTLKKLNEAEAQVAKEIANMTKKCAVVKDQLDKNNATLSKVGSQNQVLHNLINNIDLEELKKQTLEKQQNFQETLTALEEGLVKAKESCNTAEERKANLLKSLENEVKIGNELEAAYDQLENEHSALVTAQEQLNSNAKTLESKASNICSLQSNVEIADSELTKLNREIAETVQKKKDTIDNLHIIEQNYEESQANLTNLQHQTEQLSKDCELNELKLANLQQKETELKSELSTVSTQLIDAKGKFFDTEKSLKDQLEKADKEFAEAQAKMEQAELECDTKMKALRDDLLAYKADTEKIKQHNQENNKQKLQELEEQINKLQCNVKKEEECLDLVKTTIKQKKTTHQNLQLELELVKVSSQECSQREDIVTAPAQPQGILKSPGKQFSSKTVSWRLPSSSSGDSDAGNLSAYWKSQDELFNELLRMSPPERLETNKARKRSRID